MEQKGGGITFLMLNPVTIAFKKCSQAKQKGNFQKKGHHLHMKITEGKKKK